MYCSKCGAQIPEGAKFCIQCGNKASVRFTPVETEGVKPNAIVESINEYVGNHNPVNLDWKDLFGDVFKHHSVDDTETVFICGTKKTTPLLSEVSTTWPKPWLYSRVLLVMIIAFILLRICWDVFDNANSLPGLIAVGSFAVPLTMLILFLEVNAYRNISFYSVILVFLVGGCASLVATLFLYEIFPSGEMDFLGACITGFVEEAGKLLIVYVFIKRLPHCHYVLNGLLIGASVGAGFAAFESAGYAFSALLQKGNVAQMIDTIYLRGFFTPGGHVAWAALSGAALMIVKGNSPLSFGMLFNSRFLKIFFIPVAFHAVWDMPFGDDMYLLKLSALTFFVWVIVLIFINIGLDEVKQVIQEKR